MHRIVIILILTVFSISEFKPLYHIADYAINYEYIATELCIEKDEEASCCKGKCYLNDQLSKAVTPIDDSNPEQRTPKIERGKIPMIVFESERIAFFATQDELDAPIIKNDEFFKDISLSTPTPPPRA